MKFGQVAQLADLQRLRDTVERTHPLARRGAA